MLKFTLNRILWSTPWWMHRIYRFFSGRILVRKTPLTHDVALGFEWVTPVEYDRRSSQIYED